MSAARDKPEAAPVPAGYRKLSRAETLSVILATVAALALFLALNLSKLTS